MKFYHLKGNEYKMFKSLQDLVKRELKNKVNPKKDTTPGEMNESSQPSSNEKEDPQDDGVIHPGKMIEDPQFRGDNIPKGEYDIWLRNRFTASLTQQ